MRRIERFGLLFVVIIVLFSVLPVHVYGQIDTVFWFAAPEVASNNRNYDKPIFLRASTLNKSAEITISQPANKLFKPIQVTVAANSTQSIDLTDFIDDVECQYNEIGNKGLLIKATSPITVYYDVASTYCNCNPEIFALKGQNALGTKFYVPFQNFTKNAPQFNPTPYASFILVASEDNTTITITPTQDLIDHLANKSFTIKLNKGEVYNATATNQSASGHPSGTKVESDKPIAITMSDDLLSGEPWDQARCADLIGDQIVPVSKLGTEYIIVNGYLNDIVSEKVFIVATNDQTGITVNGVKQNKTLNAGETMSYDIVDNSTIITSNLPIYILHLSGIGCELGGAIIPSINCRGSFTVPFVRASYLDFFVSIVIEKGFESSFLVNNLPNVITADMFSEVKNTNGKYVSAKINLSSNITVNQGASISNTSHIFQMGIINGDLTTGCSYGFFSNFGQIEATHNLLICGDSSLVLKSEVVADRYSWLPLLNTSNSLVIKDSGVYRCQSNYNECTATETFVVKKRTLAIPELLAIRCGNADTIAATKGFDSYIWSPTADTSRVITVRNAGTNIVTASTDNCTLRDTCSVFESCENNMLAYYRFCGCSLADFSGNKHDLISTSDTNCSQSELNNSIVLHNDLVGLVPRNLASYQTEFSFSTWFKSDNEAAFPVFSQTFPGGTFYITIDKKQVNCHIKYSSPNGNDETDDVQIELNFVSQKTFFLFTATYSVVTNRFSFYVNNQEIETFLPKHPLSAYGQGFVIANAPEIEYPFNGTMDEIRLFSKALSLHEIDSLYSHDTVSFRLGKDIQAKAGESVRLNAPDGYFQYKWTLPKADPVFSQDYVASKSGMYIASAVDQYSCLYTDTIKVNYQTSGPPFNCNGKSYLSTEITDSSTSIFNVFIASNATANFVPTGFGLNTAFNALGFNHIDGCIYAFDMNNHEILRIFSNNTSTSIGLPEELKSIQFFIADCDENGNFMLVSADGRVFVVDTKPLYPKVIKEFTIGRIIFPAEGNNTADIAINPIDGLLYFFTSDTRKLNRFDPKTMTIEEISSVESSNIQHIGAIWFDANGLLYGYGIAQGQKTQSSLFQFNIADGTDQFVAEGPVAVGTDGCACAYYVDMFKTASRSFVSEGDTVVYRYTINNATRGIQTGYTFIDTLPKGFELVLTPANLFGVPLEVVKVNNRTILKARAITILQGATHFSLIFRTPCVRVDSIVKSQAHIPDLPEFIGGPLNSDDSLSFVLNDPSTITIVNKMKPSISAVPSVCEGSSFTFTSLADNSISQRWITPSNTESKGNVYTQKTATGSMSGVYKLIIDNPFCPDTLVHTLIVNKNPNVTVGFDKNTVCETQSITLWGKNASTYSWNDGEVVNNKAFVPSASKRYIVTGVDKNGCSDTGQVDVQVNPLPDVTITPSVKSLKICKGKSISLTVNGLFDSNLWSNGETVNQITISPNSSQQISVTVVGKNKCAATQQVTVDVLHNQLLDGFQNTKTLCQDVDTLTMKIPAENVFWYSDSTQSPVHDGNEYLFSLTKAESKQVLYVKTYDENGCESYFTPVIVQRNLGKSLVTILGREYRCADKKSEEIYTISHEVALDTIQWGINLPYGHYTSEPPSIIVPQFSKGVDTIKAFVKDIHGCTYKLSKVVYTIASPRADFDWLSDNASMTVRYANMSDSSMLPNSAIKLANTYSWTFWKHDSIWKRINCNDTILRYPYGYHDVKLLAVNKYGCADSISKTVFVDVYDALYVPTAFVLGVESDDLSLFQPKGISLQFYELTIYDHWGNTLWYSNKIHNGQPAEGWNGFYAGVPMKSEVYIWKIKAQFLDGVWWRNSSRDKGEFGNFLLIR